MFRVFCFPLLFLVSHAFCLHSEESSLYDQLNESQKRELAEGKVIVKTEEVPGRGARKGWAMMLMSHSQARIWAVITDYEKYKDFMPNVVNCRVDKRSGPTVIHSESVKVPVIKKTIQYTVKSEHDLAGWKTSWSYVKGDVKENSGFWKLEKQPGEKTLVTYHVLLDMGFWIPEIVQNFVIQNTFPEILRAVEKRAKDKSYEEKEKKIEAEYKELTKKNKISNKS